MRRLLVVTLMTATLAVSPASATTIHVPADQPTIQAAIDVAAVGDMILVEPGTYPESISLLGKALTLISSGGPEVTVIDATGFDTAVFCGKGETSSTVVEGFGITGAVTDAIVCVQGASPVLRNLIVRDNLRYGVTCPSSAPSFENVVFQDNANHAVWAYSSDLVFSGCTFRGNDRTGVFDQGSSTIRIEGTLFDGVGGSASASYPPVLHAERGSVVLTDCVISDHTTGGFAPIYMGEMVSALIESCTFESNTNVGTGGALACYQSPISLVNCTFRGNVSEAGGGNGGGACGFRECEVTIEGCVFDGNHTTGSGGAIFLDPGGNLQLTNSLFTGNQADLGAGAVSLVGDSYSTFDISHCLFAGSSSIYGPGVLELRYCTGAVEHVTIYDCSAAATSGMIMPFGNSTVVITSSIIAFCDGIGIKAPYYSAYPEVSCCDVYWCSAGAYGGVMPDLTGYHGNISADPMFCEPDAGDLTLEANSPCSAENNPSCGLIGALDIGCPPSTGIAGLTEMTSWGAIKALYR